MNIGWLGVGKMGLPMAGFLVQAGYRVTAFDPVTAQVERLVAVGGHAAPSLSAAVGDANVVFSSLPDDAALLGVALGDGGLLSELRTGTIYVDTSTVSPGASARVAEAATARGIPYLRMPVSGNANSAKAGQLTALVSGSRAAWEQVKPAVEKFSTAQVYVGDAEQARYMKLVINLLVANTAALMAEALALGRKGGIEWETMLDGLAASTLASPWLKAKTQYLKTRDFTPTFTVPQILKDVDLMLAAGAADGVPLPLTALTRQLMQGVIGAGWGDEDFIAIVKQVEAQSGLPTDRV
jgi:3-hydroxyisobutyrate dehydrogenase-like beta-hydroxyacid dehydrogenase